jgi:hypothetical protein
VKFIWRKLGLIYRLKRENRHSKLLTHTANPLPVHLHGDIYRIFFSSRDVNNRSSVGGVDIDIVRGIVIKEYDEPFFVHGDKGSFFERGVSIGNCYEANGKRFILFMGWQTPKDSHWRGDIGRLLLTSDFRLALDSDKHFLGINEDDPISLSYPWVLKNDINEYTMWYGSTITWDAGNGEMLHAINYASSSDGYHWKRHGLCIPYEINKAQAFSRPTVIGNSQQGYQMWFSYRSGSGEKYRIGYAFSQDGSEWKLALKLSGIDVSNEGWDSEMIEYPYVFEHNNETYMLYNGNGYGKTGFGLAVLDAH